MENNNSELASRYVHKRKAKCFDIDADKLISIVHVNDAHHMGIRPLDRIQLFNPKNGKKVVTVVDTTTSMVKEKEIGLFKDAIDVVNVCENEEIEVTVVPRPKSVKFIKKKLDAKKLTEEEIIQIVNDIADNKLSEIEISAFMAGVYINGFDLDETVSMTKALVNHGKKLTINKEPVVDKHSVGGLNGRATMIIIPILAAGGLYIPKTSSRSITSACGTADAMEVLANVSLSIDEIKKITEKVGGVIAWGGAVELAPADDKIIKIEHPLSLDPEGQVIASVLAKKASVSAKYVVIDLPVGPDVKIKNRELAEEIGKKFVEVGKRLGMKVEAVITNGTEPSGRAFGAVSEAKYVLEILEGKFYDNLAQKSCELAGVIFELVGKAKDGKGTDLAKEILKSGKALKKMQEIIQAQGGKPVKSEEIQTGKIRIEVVSTEEGEISKINVKKLIEIAKIAGAPGESKAGVYLHVEDGQKIKKGQLLFEIFGNNERKVNLAKEYADEEEVISLEKIIWEKIK